MKSPQIINCIPAAEHHRYSDLKVMRSGGGFYVGTTFRDPDHSFDEPGSRDSDYFHTAAEADAFLKRLENGDPVAIAAVRYTP